ncbi:hypothetical protein ABID22_000996 [Pontibacter aydingkolensis]|uniref:DUF547 domain-containing protein n=1 Tax=Pontibacter aydingkolensis TaxID=1911536 RepID=A0ABS7CTD8_9BACT|nr:DUF547 domain-containing protein [Pontibacter aydingkolensis]MBW7466752.1 DUF547 domain-containing protein [Pontibacter aydingkolensis]
MRSVLLLSILFSYFLLASPAQAGISPSIVSNHESSFYTSVTELLQRNVANGQVKYKVLQKDKAKLDKLVRQIELYSLNKATPAEKKAFYINAYNVLVLKQVMEHYPIKSVMDVPGFFDKQKYTVAGESLTLNELEKGKLLKPYKDARLHFALVCAAKSCPALLNEAYTPQRVEEQLQKQTKLAMQDATFTKVLPKQKHIQVSELFKWYEADFVAEAPSIIAYINKFRSSPIPQDYKVNYYTYNWSLNELSR